jgi:two-component system, chemotaxis family, CheB/CheR fusion protein
VNRKTFPVKSKTTSPKHQEKQINSGNLFPVVGIGASAGGLDAFKTLLKAIPEDSGMAYILLQHLNPTHESLLPDILHKVTQIPVLEISDEIKIEPDHIYVMPSNKIMVVTNGKLQLSPRPAKSKTERNLLIDILFSSLAEVHQSYAIGVVLSGTASDGTLGLKAIKDYGGITIAQDENSAEYEGMPNSAIQAGVVDFILPPDKIPAKLLELAKIINTAATHMHKPPVDDSVIQQIISLLRIRNGTDFTHYKKTTIRRRVLRRMAIKKCAGTAEYFNFLRENKQEQDVLCHDFLIPVTSFFRDSKSYDYLSNTIFPLIVKNKPAGENIRIWVAGCSTGEEVYSFAICLKEFLNSLTSTASNNSVQIFGSDISELAIDKARSGTYTKTELDGVSSKRLSDFFTKINGRYKVKRQIRDMCIFAYHNFLKDPPFGRIDLISCRNVLIYMESYLQKRALMTFHYALNQKGFLMLGKSESAGAGSTLFASFAKNHKIFTRKDTPGRFMHVLSQRSELNLNQSEDKPIIQSMHSNFQKIADEIMLSKYTPVGVVVNESLDIVQFRGSTSNYLEQSSGKPSHNLLDMAKRGLVFELRSILNKAKKGEAIVKKENIPLKVNESLRYITIEAIPLPEIIDPHYLVLFHDNKSPSNKKLPEKDSVSIKKSPEDKKDLRIRQLEKELEEVREDIRIVTEEQESANEELQSANEELQSSSEELQSLNEELETSQEELQSTNEELIVINHEMVSLNEQVAAERNYSEAIVASIREPLLVLDNNLRVRTANNAFYNLFKVQEHETEGFLIYDLGNKQWNIPELRTLLEKIIPEKSNFNDFEVIHTFQNIGELILLLNAREISRKEDTEKLILLSIENITDQVIAKRKSLEIQELYTKELENLIRQRTLELKNANIDLEQKNRDLLKMNRELEEFAYVSSHDLQEPLRKLQTFASRIIEKEDSNLSKKGRTYFHLMQDAANRMQKLIEDLLAFSRLTTSERKFEPTDLNTILEEVKATFKEVIEEKHATIESGKLGKANIIPFQFNQLMHNLISNALKFSKPDLPPHIVIKSRIKKGSELKAKNLLPQNKYVHLSIKDNGIGFESEFSEKIFEVFQKLHSKDEYPGTGIGLATVKKIVENHGGIVSATGKLNKGATFNIYIPTFKTNSSL